MAPLKYHAGQRAVQEEARTVEVADGLADWVGPVTQFAGEADLIVMAVTPNSGRLEFGVLSGPPPLVRALGPTDDAPQLTEFELSEEASLPPGPVGGLAISMQTARRARFNGEVPAGNRPTVVVASEAFTNCRKYVVPSAIIGDDRFFGPESRTTIDLADPAFADLIARAETAFLATVSPDGIPDVSHRGGPPGFLQLDAVLREIKWPEYVGDGMLKSAGNLRSTGIFTLLIPDFESGDAVEICGRGDYVNTRPERRPRRDPLIQHREPFPLQGEIGGEALEAFRLTRALHRRERIAGRERFTSKSAIGEQAPQ